MAKTPTSPPKPAPVPTPDATDEAAAAPPPSESPATPEAAPVPTPDATDEAAVAPDPEPIHDPRVARRALMSARLAELADIAAGGAMPDLSIMGGAAKVLSWRLTDDALVIVSTGGRKYRLDRLTGVGIDLATGEEVL